MRTWLSARASNQHSNLYSGKKCGWDELEYYALSESSFLHIWWGSFKHCQQMYCSVESLSSFRDKLSMGRPLYLASYYLVFSSPLQMIHDSINQNAPAQHMAKSKAYVRTKKSFHLGLLHFLIEGLQDGRQSGHHSLRWAIEILIIDLYCKCCLPSQWALQNAQRWNYFVDGRRSDSVQWTEIEDGMEI